MFLLAILFAFLHLNQPAASPLQRRLVEAGYEPVVAGRILDVAESQGRRFGDSDVAANTVDYAIGYGGERVAYPGDVEELALLGLDAADRGLVVAQLGADRDVVGDVWAALPEHRTAGRDRLAGGRVRGRELVAVAFQVMAVRQQQGWR